MNSPPTCASPMNTTPDAGRRQRVGPFLTLLAASENARTTPEPDGKR